MKDFISTTQNDHLKSVERYHKFIEDIRVKLENSVTENQILREERRSQLNNVQIRNEDFLQTKQELEVTNKR